jgi:HTH-like domain
MTVTKDAAAAVSAYGYRRVVCYLERKQGLVSNGKRVLRVMREHGGRLVRQCRLLWRSVLNLIGSDSVWRRDNYK